MDAPGFQPLNPIRNHTLPSTPKPVKEKVDTKQNAREHKIRREERGWYAPTLAVNICYLVKMIHDHNSTTYVYCIAIVRCEAHTSLQEYKLGFLYSHYPL